MSIGSGFQSAAEGFKAGRSVTFNILLGLAFVSESDLTYTYLFIVHADESFLFLTRLLAAKNRFAFALVRFSFANIGDSLLPRDVLCDVLAWYILSRIYFVEKSTNTCPGLLPFDSAIHVGL